MGKIISEGLKGSDDPLFSEGIKIFSINGSYGSALRENFMRFVRRMEKLDDHFGGRTLEVSESLLKQYLGDKFFKMAKELLKGPPYMVTFPDAGKPEYRPLNELDSSELIGTIMMQHGFKPKFT